jgi:hypothetical protein
VTSSEYFTSNLSAIPTFISHEGHPPVLELWTIQGPCSSAYPKVKEGDCGTLACCGTGKIFGHVIAGSPYSGRAYIVPMYKVVEDIQRRFGESHLEFSSIASTGSSSSVAASPIVQPHPITARELVQYPKYPPPTLFLPFPSIILEDAHIEKPPYCNNA